MQIKKIFILIFSIAMLSCTSSNVYDNGTGNSDYRELQSEIRDGETELVITGKNLESTANDIRGTINAIKSTSVELEQSIGESASSEQGIGDVIQSVRNRPIQ